ncbi:hypothetical protein AAG570_007725 [Ranatra chinensis]|uniref:Uncharacterized protein n=1 Tax=Ranatra chinensis TaxID=642074 RepID=A0ABD0XUC7_9HEMI
MPSRRTDTTSFPTSCRPPTKCPNSPLSRLKTNSLNSDGSRAGLRRTLPIRRVSTSHRWQDRPTMTRTGPSRWMSLILYLTSREYQLAAKTLAVCLLKILGRHRNC